MTDKVFDQETDVPKTYDQEYISKLRSECAKRRLELRDVEAEKERLEAKVDAHEAGEEDPELVAARERLERAEKALSDRSREWDELQLKAKVISKAEGMGYYNGEDGYKLVDLAGDIDLELRRVLAKHPGLKKPGTADPLPLGPFNVSAEDLGKLGGDGGR